MSIELTTIEVLHERRIRLVFSSPLASGAFGVPGPAAYVIASSDARAPNPSVQAAMAVPGSSAVVELALGSALVKGALYTVTAIGIPAADTSTSTGASASQFRYGQRTIKENVDPIQRDRQRLLYGIDLLWNGADFQETATGDLDRVSGSANVAKALDNAVESNGLPWDSSFGAGAREFVDSPSTASGTLTGAMAAQILKDPRVRSVKFDVAQDGDDSYVNATPTLISGEPIEPVSIEVPSQ